jgi:hypothetical protein
MSDETNTNRPEEPYWAERMRAAGYPVRVGTDPRPLPYEPEISYHHLAKPHVRARWRVIEMAQDLWSYVAALKRRLVSR